MIYLDNAASTPITNAVYAEILPFIRCSYGNPSSSHSLGKEIKKAIEIAREQVAASINASPEQIFFTSGATESNNWVLSNFDCTLCSGVEHSSIYNYPKAIRIGNDWLFNQIYTHRPVLITHMLVNNETGDIYKIKKMIETAHQMRHPFHTDATQAFGHIPIDVKELDVDSLSLSGHKIHALKGVGILYLKNPDKYNHFLYGGNQEKGFRAGTENVLGIVGMGKACKLYNYDEKANQYLLSLKNHLKDFILANIPDVRINSSENSVSNILNVSFKNIESENLMMMLNKEGIYVSSGSACNSHKHKPSHVLQYLKVPEEYINSAIRFSFSRLNTIDEIKITEEKLKENVVKLRSIYRQ